MLNLNWTGAKILIRNSEGKYGSNLEAIDTKLFIKQDSFFLRLTSTLMGSRTQYLFNNKITNVARPSCGALTDFLFFNS